MTMICRTPHATMLMLTLLMTTIAHAQQPADVDVLTSLEAEPWLALWGYQARITGKAFEAKPILLGSLRRYSCEHPDPDSGIECGAIALNLQTIDPDSREGEKYLVQPVEAFLAERMPVPFRSEADARNKTLSPEYKAWIEARQWSPPRATQWETMYGLLLLSAASIGDPQLNPLFRRGLDSNSFGIVMASVRGLALLGDKSFLPQILAAHERVKRVYGEGANLMILFELWNFDDPDIDRLVKNKLPEELRNEPILPTLPRLKPEPSLRPQR